MLRAARVRRWKACGRTGCVVAALEKKVAGAANWKDMIELTRCVFNVVLYMYLYIGCTLSLIAFC